MTPFAYTTNKIAPIVMEQRFRKVFDKTGKQSLKEMDREKNRLQRQKDNMVREVDRKIDD